MGGSIRLTHGGLRDGAEVSTRLDVDLTSDVPVHEQIRTQVVARTAAAADARAARAAGLSDAAALDLVRRALLD